MRQPRVPARGGPPAPPGRHATGRLGFRGRIARRRRVHRRL